MYIKYDVGLRGGDKGKQICKTASPCKLFQPSGDDPKENKIYQWVSQLPAVQCGCHPSGSGNGDTCKTSSRRLHLGSRKSRESERSPVASSQGARVGKRQKTRLAK